MIISITPHDIIKRCIWLKYKRFALNNFSEQEIKKIVEENKTFTISEDMAYVIGLLKIIETDNLIHRFNQDITNLLNVKSTINNDRVLINKSVIVKEIIEYKNRFPEYFKSDLNFENSIKELKDYINEIYDKLINIEEIKIKKIKGKVEKTFTYLLSNSVKKILDMKR